MAAGLRTAVLVSVSGAVAVFSATQRARRSFTCNADTSFQRNYDVRDFPAAPGYHLINNFWFPQAQPQQTIPFHVGFVNVAGLEVDREEDDSSGDFDLTSPTAVALGSTLFHHGYRRKISMQEAIRRSKHILEIHREEIGDPGLVVGVSIDGHVVWTDGLGFADFENRVPCHADTVMRIASIGKAISMTIVAKLWEQGFLDLDKPVQEYVPDFPFKTFSDQPAQITCRQLVSHLSGIRHYSKTKSGEEASRVSKPEDQAVQTPKQTPTAKSAAPAAAKYNEFDEPEYYLTTPFKTTLESVALFKDDPLLVKPGEFLYTTHGWTLLCAVVEAVTKRKLTDLLKELFRDLDMTNTFLDEHEPIVHNRSRNYRRDAAGRLKNAPYVDNSYKWAGGGLLSTVGDLLKFAHLMLYAYQCRDHQSPGYLKSSTLHTMWTLVEQTKKQPYTDNGYGMGWMVFPERLVGSWCLRQPHVVYHTGGAIGASSVLAIIPRAGDRSDAMTPSLPPQGIVVTIIANLEQAALYKKSVEIAQIFDQVERRAAT